MKLKRCPFCNAEKFLVEKDRLTCAVRCLACGALGPFALAFRGVLGAAQMWNGENHHQRDALVARLEPDRS